MKFRSLIAVALLVPAAAFAAPAKTAAPAAKSAARPAAASSASANPVDNLQVGGFLGYETDDVSGVSLRVDGEIPFQALSPQINLSWVGSLGYSRLTKSQSAFGMTTDFTANILKAIPAARFTFPVNPQISLFADAGLGLAYVSAKIEESVPGYGSASVSDSTINFIMRLGAGAFYQVNPKTKIGAMIEIDPFFGDFGFSGASSQSPFLIQAGAMFRM